MWRLISIALEINPIAYKRRDSYNNLYSNLVLLKNKKNKEKGARLISITLEINPIMYKQHDSYNNLSSSLVLLRNRKKINKKN